MNRNARGEYVYGLNYKAVRTSGHRWELRARKILFGNNIWIRIKQFCSLADVEIYLRIRKATQ